MAIYKLSDDFYEDSYTLMAIHCTLEDYRLAYFLNREFAAAFKKSPDITLHNDHIAFSLYVWEDHKEDTIWSLIANISRSGSTALKDQNTLFNNTVPETTHYLIPERKQTDYFLKIEGAFGQEEITDIVSTINNIPQTITTYAVSPDQLKSKHNLII